MSVLCPTRHFIETFLLHNMVDKKIRISCACKYWSQFPKTHRFKQISTQKRGKNITYVIIFAYLWYKQTTVQVCKLSGQILLIALRFNNTAENHDRMFFCKCFQKFPFLCLILTAIIIRTFIRNCTYIIYLQSRLW